MKKILIVGILIAVVLVSIGLVTAGNIFGTNDVTSESDNIRNGECNFICNGQGNCICVREGSCICDGQCNTEQCCNQYMNDKCLQNNNSNGCCKIN
jgi:hypothetical protein